MRKLTPEQWKKINRKRYGSNRKPSLSQLEDAFNRQAPKSPDDHRFRGCIDAPEECAICHHDITEHTTKTTGGIF